MYLGSLKSVGDNISCEHTEKLMKDWQRRVRDFCTQFPDRQFTVKHRGGIITIKRIK